MVEVPGTGDAKTFEPDDEYIIPLGKARVALSASEEAVDSGTSCFVISYGMGIYWAKEAAKFFEGQVEILDLRTLNPLDWEAVEAGVRKHNKVMVLTEEPLMNSFAESLAGRIGQACFEVLDAPVMTLGAKNLPAIALNVDLEKEMLPNAEKVTRQLGILLNY